MTVTADAIDLLAGDPPRYPHKIAAPATPTAVEQDAADLGPDGLVPVPGPAAQLRLTY